LVRDSCATQKTGVMDQCAPSLIGWLILALVLVFLCASPSPLGAHEIAILKSSDIAAYNHAVSGLQAELADTATLTVYDLEGDVTRGKKLARKIRASDAALVIAVGLKAALAAKIELVDVPVIYCMVLDPEKYDLRASNLTGISLRVPIERQFNTIHALLPNLKQLGVLYDPEKTAPLVDEARRVAARLGFELVEHKVHAEKELPSAIRALLPKASARSSAGRIELNATPVRSSNRRSAMPWVRRSAFIMNSNARSSAATSCSCCTGCPCSARSM
jgi:putative ABC transport system substrate-binding protein